MAAGNIDLISRHKNISRKQLGIVARQFFSLRIKEHYLLEAPAETSSIRKRLTVKQVRVFVRPGHGSTRILLFFFHSEEIPIKVEAGRAFIEIADPLFPNRQFLFFREVIEVLRT